MSHVGDLYHRLNMGVISERDFYRQYDDAQYDDYIERLEIEYRAEMMRNEDAEYEEYCREEYKKYVRSFAAPKGGHTHNCKKNALKRLKRCHICDKPITKYEGYRSRAIGHICMECWKSECEENAGMAGIPLDPNAFNFLRNPYIKIRRQ